MWPLREEKRNPTSPHFTRLRWLEGSVACGCVTAFGTLVHFREYRLAPGHAAARDFASSATALNTHPDRDSRADRLFHTVSTVALGLIQRRVCSAQQRLRIG
jgi:hypothetical protein